MTETLFSVEIFEVGREGACLSWSPGVVMFEGRRYRRNRHGYYISFHPVRPFRLHREMWALAHGPIPQWHHIHHVDGDVLNNLLSNLQCLSWWDHASLHARERVASGRLPAEFLARRYGRSS